MVCWETSCSGTVHKIFPIKHQNKLDIQIPKVSLPLSRSSRDASKDPVQGGVRPVFGSIGWSVFSNTVVVHFSLVHPLTCLVSCFLLQVLTAIYPAPPVALPTGVVSVTPVPPAGAAPAQDVANPPSPLAVGLQGSAVATPHPGMGTEVEVKHESQLDAQSDAQGLSSCVTSSSMGTCTSSIIAGNGPLI